MNAPSVFLQHRGVIVWVAGCSPDVQIFYFDPIDKVVRGFVIELIIPSMEAALINQIDAIISVQEPLTFMRDGVRHINCAPNTEQLIAERKARIEAGLEKYPEPI